MLDYIKPNVIEHITENDMYAWHAHLIKRSGKNLLVLMYDFSRFTVVFYGLKKSHIKELYPMISVAVMNSMMDAGIPLDAIGAYVDRRPESLSFSKTKNRTLVARLNKAVEMADHILGTDGYHPDSIEQRHASLFCNELLVCEDNYKVFYYPKNKLRECANGLISSHLI
ncbi:hypothetical protein JN09_000696 [Acholeplasma morum]|nr:hypothetical protein [Paracholeplasma morum]MBM7453370.1 hypothetical protein [Paracholeplasma morum]